MWDLPGVRPGGALFDELTANKREGSGSGGLSFVASPAGSIREWAIYYIDADGNVLGDPDIVTMSFDASGVGNVAAGGGSRLSTFGVSSKKGGGAGQFFASTGRVSVQDSGANAAYIGIAELSNDGSGNELVPDPDMDTMDATAFATFQAEGLDAIVSLSSYAIQVDGTLSIDGLSISKEGVSKPARTSSGTSASTPASRPARRAAAAPPWCRRRSTGSRRSGT